MLGVRRAVGTDYVVPAVEIIDTRIMRVDPETKSTRKVMDTISDNAADAGIVLGGRPIKQWTRICAGSLPTSTATVRSKNQAWPRPCSIIRPKAWPG